MISVKTAHKTFQVTVDDSTLQSTELDERHGRYAEGLGNQ